MTSTATEIAKLIAEASQEIVRLDECMVSAILAPSATKALLLGYGRRAVGCLGAAADEAQGWVRAAVAEGAATSYPLSQALEDIRRALRSEGAERDQYLAETLDQWVRQFIDRAWEQGHHAEAEAAYEALDGAADIQTAELAALAARSVW